MKIKKILLIVTSLTILLTGCGKSSSVSDQSFGWKIEILSVEVKTDLVTKEIVTLYTGDKDTVLHENFPAEGNVFLILDLSISKNGDESSTFDWEKLSVLDNNGVSYQRLENDSFLEQHNYAPRMTGLPIRFGENEGWVCFELPASAAKGKLYLQYSTSEGQNKIEIKK